MSDWSTDYNGHFPGSNKVYVGEHQVPFREVSLSEGNQPLRVYDTSGPLGVDPHEGLPAKRADWIAARGDLTEVERIIPLNDELTPSTLRRRTFRGTKNVTQLHYARKGIITPEMEFIATREGVTAEFVRKEVA